MMQFVRVNRVSIISIDVHQVNGLHERIACLPISAIDDMLWIGYPGEVHRLVQVKPKQKESDVKTQDKCRTRYPLSSKDGH